MRRLCKIWERIMLEIFGDQAPPHIDNFGRYIVLRQKRIYKVFGNVEGCINQIYVGSRAK